jgi:hypothetical protein
MSLDQFVERILIPALELSDQLSVVHPCDLPSKPRRSDLTLNRWCPAV